MKVSIITICFNSGDTIKDTIESVLSQDYANIEYIIKDGGSTDNTLSLLENYSASIAKIISQPDGGLYDALNQGVEAATGDIIGFIHADDLLNDNHVVSRIVKEFEESGADAIYGDLQYVNKEDTSKVFRHWDAGKYKEGMFLKGWMPPHPTFYAKKSIYNKLGLYNVEFKSAGDYELMLRFIHKYKISLSYINEVLVRMRVGGKSNASLKNRIRANKEDRKAWKINGLSALPTTMLQKPLRKVKQYFKK